MQASEMRFTRVHYRWVFTLFLIIVGFGKICNSEELLGKKYKIIKPLYLMGVYDDVGNKRLSKETASAYLLANRHYKKSYVAFEDEVPVGTIVTVIGVAPKPWYLYFNSDRYFVKLEPDMSQGLEVKLALDSPLEKGLGDSSGLNPEFFSRLDKE